MRTANDSHDSRTDGEPGSQVTRPEAARPRGLGWLRRPSARDRSRWARRALDWPLVNYLEGAVWLGVAITLGVSYYGSYDNLVDVLTALGYAAGPAHAVPIALDAPLTVSVIGQFLLARWKSPAMRRWRLFAVTVITAPLTLAGNALHGALRFASGSRAPLLDLGLLNLHRPEVVIRLVAAMVPAIGVWTCTHPDQPAGLDRPWYTSKRAPSFADALAALRSDTWSAILDASARDLQHPQIAATLISVLAHAA